MKTFPTREKAVEHVFIRCAGPLSGFLPRKRVWRWCFETTDELIRRGEFKIGSYNEMVMTRVAPALDYLCADAAADKPGVRAAYYALNRVFLNGRVVRDLPFPQNVVAAAMETVTVDRDLVECWIYEALAHAEMEIA